MTVDHNVLSEECEYRHNHRYAVVVQDLATELIQSYPCETKTSQKMEKSLQKFLGPTRKPKVIYIDTSLNFRKSSWNIVAIRAGRKMVGGFYGMLLLTAKHTRSLV